MFKEYSKYRVLRVFLDSPTIEFGLREISRLAKLAPVSIMRYLRDFEKGGIIKKFGRKDRPVYQAERDNENFILYKKLSILYELHSSLLVEELWQKLGPRALILYGSHAKGEATEDSDIDIFVIGKNKEIDLDMFEKSFNKEIHLMFNSDIKNIPKELKNNLINGIVLKGYFKVF